jgi:2-polyprenyl-3-methyl-5-hydroxy-6-metoxy-1,4-benzoquinol methylase
MPPKNTEIYDKYFTTQAVGQGNLESITKESLDYFNQNLFKFFPENKNIKILEIGCGFGRYLKYIKDRDYNHITGIDISKEQIEAAKKSYNLDDVHVADAIEYLTTINQKFDVIMLLDVVEHLDLEYALELGSKVYQSLNKDGILIMQTPNGLSPLSLYRYGDMTHVRAMNVQSSQQYLSLSGFQNMSFHEAPPDTVSIKNIFRRITWEIFRIFIMFYMFVINGNFGGRVFTPNIISVAKK